ncbi:MAG: hypothetical protein RLZZ127_1679, partial [Planctomycetota bacterium]
FAAAVLAAGDPVAPTMPEPLAAEGQGERLARRIGLAGLVPDGDGTLRWGGTGGLRVVDTAGSAPDAVVETAAGRLVVPRRLLARPGLAATVAACAALAREAGLAGEDLSVAEGFLLGPGLRRADAIVVPQAVLRPATAGPGVAARWTGTGAELVQVERPDGMLHRLVLPGRRAVALPVRGGEGMQLVVELAPEGDPVPLRARLVQAATVLAAWDGRQFDHDEVRWRAQFGALPPHLAIIDEAGRLDRLVTRHGSWSAAQGGDTGIAALAQALPDAAHAALFVQVALVAAAERGRDPLQVLGEPVDGRLPVGPAEAAELIQAIARRQGRSPLVLAGGRQPLCAWSELAGDGRWHVHGLGLAVRLQAEDPDPVRAVAALLRQADPVAMPDPDAFAVRFRLDTGPVEAVAGWAALADPERARLAREAARLRARAAGARVGIVLRPAAATADGAPERRLAAAALAARGQPTAAADLIADDAEDPASPLRRIGAGTALVALVAPRDAAAAVAIAARVVAEAEREGLPDAAARIAGALAAAGAPGPALAAMAGVLDPFEAALDRPAEGPALAAWAAAGTACLAAAGPDALPGDPRLQRLAALVQRWLEERAFSTLPAAQAYRAAADYYAAVLGEARLRTLVAAAGPPPAGDHDHVRRTGSLAQLHLDLPWIALSGPWWVSRIDQDADPATARAAAAALAERVPPGFAAPGAAAAARIVAAALDRQPADLAVALGDLAAAGDPPTVWWTAARLGRAAGAVDPLSWSQWPRLWADAGLDRGALAAMAWSAVAAGGPGADLARASLPLLRDVALARDAALAADECQAVLDR